MSWAQDPSNNHIEGSDMSVDEEKDLKEEESEEKVEEATEEKPKKATRKRAAKKTTTKKTASKAKKEAPKKKATKKKPVKKKEPEVEPIKEGDFLLLEMTGKSLDTGEVFDTTDEELAKAEGVYSEDRVYGPKLVVVGEGWVLKGLDNKRLFQWFRNGGLCSTTLN